MVVIMRFYYFLNKQNIVAIFIYSRKDNFYLFFRDVLASEVLKEESLTLSINDTIYEDVKGSEHHGQGDGPPVETTTH